MSLSNHGGTMADFLCCRCGSIGDPKCEVLSDTCSFGCSPYVLDLQSHTERHCTALSYDINNPDYHMPDWPLSFSQGFEGIHYAKIYKNNAPYAYSWQFNDMQATYQCKNADYRIVFCQNETQSNGGNSQPTDTTTTTTTTAAGTTTTTTTTTSSTNAAVTTTTTKKDETKEEIIIIEEDNS